MKILKINQKFYNLESIMDLECFLFNTKDLEEVKKSHEFNKDEPFSLCLKINFIYESGSSSEFIINEIDSIKEICTSFKKSTGLELLSREEMTIVRSSEDYKPIISIEKSSNKY